MPRSSFAFVALALLAPAAARADGDGSGDGFQARSLEPLDSVSDAAPRSKALQAALEEVGIVGTAWALYGAKNFHTEPFPGPGPGSFFKKITGQAISFDANSISTNFVGHPLAGTAYYLAARGNRLPAWMSGLYAAGASTAWELVEYRENVSVNDMVVTPLAGIAIGETLSQFGDLSERAGLPALSWVVNFSRRFHDWVDGVPTAPAPGPVQHDLRVASSMGSLAAPGAGALPVARFTLGGSLLRARGYGEAGRGQSSLADGGASFLLEGTSSREGPVDGRLAVQAVLTGLYWRDLAGDEDGLSGQDLVVSLTAAYRADMHLYRGATWRIDRFLLVEAPGLGLSWRAHLGGPRLEVRLDLAPAFGGVTPAALPGWLASSPSPEALSAATRLHGYAFAWGGAAAPSLELRWRGLAAGGSARFEALRALRSPDPDPAASPARVSTEDRRLEARAWISLDLPVPGLGLSATWERRWRQGSMGGVTRSDGDEAVLGGLSWGF